jgi:hypothetical protein
MTAERFWLVIYMAGDLIWFSYAVRRFCHARGDGVAQAVLALLWPMCVAVYVPYRIFRLVGVRAG